MCGVVCVQCVDNANGSHQAACSSSGSNDRDVSPMATETDARNGKVASLMPFTDVVEKFSRRVGPICVTFAAVPWGGDPEIERGAKDVLLKQQPPKRKLSRDSEGRDSTAAAAATTASSVPSASADPPARINNSDMSSVPVPSTTCSPKIEPPSTKRARVPI